MKPALKWIQNNPILITAVILCIAALAMLTVVHFQGLGFRKQLRAHDATIRDVEKLNNTEVKIPSKHVGKPEDVHKVVVNETINDAIGQLYRDMKDELDLIQNMTEAFNKDQNPHLPFIDMLFPDPGNERVKLYEARDLYRKAFPKMLGKYSEHALYPQLNAGAPLDMAGLAEVEEQAHEEFLNRGLVRKRYEELNDKQKEEHYQHLMLRKMQSLQRQARNIHIYADESAFELGTWCNQPERPTLAQAWEGQMGLWLHQDIIEAIAIANHVRNPNHNVLTAPVKRLLKIEIGNAYLGKTLIGLGSAGGTGTGPKSRRRSASSSSKSRKGGSSSRSDTKLKGAFELTPTGRAGSDQADDIYDVRLIKIVVIIDWARIGEFIDALAHTNLMTVLHMNIKDVDEYAALSNGYLFGKGDMVEATIVIESLWLRSWTTKLMPKTVQQSLGIIKADGKRSSTASSRRKSNRKSAKTEQTG